MIDSDAPAWRALPAQRTFSPEFLDLRPRIYEWIEDYYDRDHLTRAGDWMLALAPDAPEYLVVAALLHDLERKVPGGPWLDLATDSWDDRAYNDAHTGRSAVVVATWLTASGCGEELALAVAQPIREHEFGGSPDGDLMQAADSISFLETNAPLVSGWANRGKCTPEKALEKLRWMGERVRHPEGSRIARRMMERAIEQFDRELERKR
ncbi:MAG: hypothetical protein AB7V58_16025 [Solirubrobacterales bacterium]